MSKSNSKFSEEDYIRGAKLAEEYNNRYASEVMGVHPRTIRKWKARVRNEKLTDDFTVEDYPTGNEPIDELIENRIKKYALKSKAKNHERLINVRINVDGPIGIAHFGDPHIDDDGTNIAELLAHADLVQNTEGMFGGNIGDNQNNWVGRLARLYGEQSTSAKESGDPLEWIVSQQNGIFHNNGVRINLVFPNKKEVRINARHTFAGHSMWNTAHGISKAVQMGWRDHVLTAGHTHVSGYQVLKDPATGLISHAIRIASYKEMDRYAEEKGLPDQNIFKCPVTIIDPRYDDDDSRLVTTIFDPNEGRDYLTWKRSKKS
jgi:transposase-like protein